MARSLVLTVTNVLLRGATMGGRFVLLLALARYLPAAAVGLYALFAAAVQWGIYLQGLDFYVVNVREVAGADPRGQARRIRDAAVLAGIMMLVSAAIWPLLVGAGLLPWDLLGCLLPLLALESTSQEASRLLNVLGRPLASSVVLLVRGGAWMYVLAAAMVVLPEVRSLDVVLAVWVAGAGSSVVLAVWLLRGLPWRDLPPIDWRWIRTGVGTSLPLLLGSLSLRAVPVFDRWLVGETGGGVALGVFGFYAAIAAALSALVESGVGVVFFPQMMRAWQAGDADGFTHARRALRRAILGFTLLAVPALLVGVWLVVEHATPPVYAAHFEVFVVLLAASALSSVATIPQYALWTWRRYRAIVTASVLGLVVAVVIDLAAVPGLGIDGAAMGQLGAASAMLVGRALAARRAPASG
ncbi:MAG: hypothetical protein R2939_02055 [Kofleriaceae bacterium]